MYYISSAIQVNLTTSVLFELAMSEFYGKFNAFLREYIMGCKFLNLFICGVSFVLASGWLDNGFSKRTQVDVDAFRHPAGAPVMLTLDSVRLEKATGEKFSPETVKLGFVSADGSEQQVDFASAGVDKVDNKLRLNFVMPDDNGRLYLYFGGRNNSYSKTEYPDILNGTALDVSKYKSDGFAKVKKIAAGMNFSQSKLTRRENADVWVEQVFPLKKEYAGMPVTLLLDAKSNSKVMWPFSIAIASLDAQKRVIGQRVCDARWSMVQTVPGKPFHQRLEGKIDPRAKYIRIRLTACRAGEKRLFDVFGKPLARKSDALPDIDITRFILVPGNIATIPGANPELYTGGVKAGTSALRLAGRTAPLYNNFSANVWSEGSWVKNQDMFFWPLNGEGTAEFYLKLDKVPEKESVILDNGRNCRASFLQLVYGNGKFTLKMNGYDKAAKGSRKQALSTYEFKRSVPYSIKPGKWMHIAVVWGGDGVALFVDGRKILSDSKTFKPASYILKKQSRTDNIAEYTAIGADTNRFLEDYRPSTDRYLTGAVDELRVSKVVRYTGDFTPAKEFSVDADTCALFSYEKNFDGKSAVGPRYISGSIHAADAPPRADVLTIEDKSGAKKVVRYVPKNVPDSNIPQYFIRETSYPVLPTPEDFKAARISKSVSKTLANGEKIGFRTAEHTVPEYVEIKAVNELVKAPFLRHPGEIDARSFADVAKSIDFSDCLTEHAKARKAFDFLVSSTDYFTFSAAAFPRYSNTPMHAAGYGLVAINSYACFQCGPLNGIASGLFTSGLGYPSVLTFGNGHLFQQVMLNGKLRVFDLSAQQYFPSRDQDEAASLDELEKDIYLFQRTRRPNGGSSHFFRMGRRGCHSVTNAPRERIEYTLYPGESFRYYPANCGLSNDLNSLDWKGDTWERFLPTWKNMQKETGADVEVGRVVQRPQPHTSQGVFLFDGKVSGGAFSNVGAESFCYRIDSPYSIISAVFAVPDKNAVFELSYDRGKNWRTLKSENGVCRAEFALRGRHVALLRVNTAARTFKSAVYTQMSPRRQTGLARAGKNELIFTSDAGKAQVTVAYRERAKQIVLDGGFYFGVVPGLERQLFTLEPGKSRSIGITGVSADAKVRCSKGITAVISAGKLTVTASKAADKSVGYVIITDGKAEKAVDFLICTGVKEYSVKDIKAAKVRRKRDKLEVRKADSTRVQSVVRGNGNLDLAGVKPGRYAIFTLTRRDNRVNSVMQATIWNGRQDFVAARTRNPGFEYYKATYGPFPARWANRTAEENSIDPWSRFRWDIATGKDTYPRISNMPLELEVKAGNKPLLLAAHTECAGVILLPSKDQSFMYEAARNLLNMSRADWMFDTLSLK